MKRVILILFILILSFAVVPYAKAANGSLYLSPSGGTYTVSNTFSVVVMINTDGVAINAAQGTLVFSPDKLAVTNISNGGSIFNLWTTEPIYSNSSGTINFGGGVPNPGYTGSAGHIITITFRARVSGAASIEWSSGAILANDGRGTNILTSMGGGNYTLGPTIISPLPETPETPVVSGAPAQPNVSSFTHPDENKWYNKSTIEFSWPLANDISGTSVFLNQKPTSNPGPISDGIFNSKKYENTEDGIWYFHIKLQNEQGWGPIKHFKVRIDTTPPQPFIIKIKEGKETDNPQPNLIFEAKDETSGIDYYEIKIDGGDSLKVTPEEISANSFKIPLQLPGKHTIVVEAFDKASNSTIATEEVNILSIESPKILDYPNRLDLGDILTIKGTSLPNVFIRCYIEKEDINSQVGEVKANEKGEWTYVHDRSLAKGVYKIYVRAVDDRGAQSYPSEKVTVMVSLPILLKIGSIIVDYLTVIIILLIIIGLIIFAVYWGWHRFRKLRKHLRKETKEAEIALHKAFNLLRKEISDQIRNLEKIKGERELTEKEKQIEEQLNKDLDVAENYIGKEVKDIKKKL